MNTAVYKKLLEELQPHDGRLVAVSKTKPVEEIRALYRAGQLIFGENKVQEMVTKYEALPKDIQWHLIGHLQTNKVKMVAPFVSLIHSVDSLKLLSEINRQAEKNARTIDCLLQIFIACEETKFGLSEEEAHELLSSQEFQSMRHIRICGLMGMATNTHSETQIESEFASLRAFFMKLKTEFFPVHPFFRELSMGMSSDYKIALRQGATLIRVGSMLFGER